MIEFHFIDHYNILYYYLGSNYDALLELRVLDFYEYLYCITSIIILYVLYVYTSCD